MGSTQSTWGTNQFYQPKARMKDLHSLTWNLTTKAMIITARTRIMMDIFSREKPLAPEGRIPKAGEAPPGNSAILGTEIPMLPRHHRLPLVVVMLNISLTIL